MPWATACCYPHMFQKPAFIWSVLAARPLWRGSSAATFGARLQLVWQAMEPSSLFESGPTHTFAIIAWVFIMRSLLTFVAFIGLARATRIVPPATA